MKSDLEKLRDFWAGAADEETRKEIGQQLANALSDKGVKNVFYVEGGAPALRKGSLP